MFYNFYFKLLLLIEDSHIEKITEKIFFREKKVVAAHDLRDLKANKENKEVSFLNCLIDFLDEDKLVNQYVKLNLKNFLS